MRELLVQTAPRLRRYAHALLGSWPVAAQADDARLRADQEADDLVHQALLGFWRAGLGPMETRRFSSGAGIYSSPSSICPDEGLKLALFRRVTALARQALSQRAPIAEANALPSQALAHKAAHMPWAPEARALPRLSFELRALIGLVALERLGHEQAAEALDLPEARVLPRLAVARAQLATEISGERRRHLVLAETGSNPEAEHGGEAVAEGDLLRYVDDLLDRGRREQVGMFLKSCPDAARRVSEWRRNDERLRSAFEPLMREPLPLTLNFFAPDPALMTRSWVKGRRGLFSGLATLLAASAGRRASSPRA